MKSIREWAKSKGIDPSAVKYDKKTKRISVDGMDYGTPTVKKGVSMMNEEVLNNTYDTNRLNTLNKQKDSALKNYESSLNKQYKPGTFTYDKNKDTSYQSALETTKRNIDEGIQRNTDEMIKRGLVGSTIQSDRANRIAAEQMRILQSDIAPKLEEQAYNRFLNQENMNRQSWQDMVANAQRRAELQTSVTNELQGALDKKRQERLQLSQYLSDKYNTTVNPTIDTAGMYRQVQGKDTFATQQIKSAKEDAQSNRAFQREQAKTQMDFQSKESEKERNFRAQQDALNRAAVSSSGGGGGSSSGGSSGGESVKLANIPNPGQNPVDIQKFINSSPGLITKDVTGETIVKNKQGVAAIIQGSILTKKQKDDLFDAYGLTNYKKEFNKQNEKNFEYARKNPIGFILGQQEQVDLGNISKEDMFRRFLYYGLWDEYVNQLQNFLAGR